MKCVKGDKNNSDTKHSSGSDQKPSSGMHNSCDAFCITQFVTTSFLRQKSLVSMTLSSSLSMREETFLEWTRNLITFHSRKRQKRIYFCTY